MTVSYSNHVATSGSLVFVKLLKRWRGSVYKLIWKDLLVFICLYYLLHYLYVFGLSEDNKAVFKEFVQYCQDKGNFIPLSFLLGFFVSNVMNRWWSQYQSIPWPNSIAVLVSSTIHGYDEVGRAMRRTIMRYVCLSLTMGLRILSPRVAKRFPKMSNMIEAGLLHENELNIIEDLERKFPSYSKTFLPIVWAASIVTRARKEGRIRDDFAVKTLIKALNSFRGDCATLMSYNTVSIPLVYPQVVIIATYSFFLVDLLAQQSTPQLESVTWYKAIGVFPVLTVLQFIFYMGWLKVAETMMNPFGEDDDDFEVNSMIDRNLQTSYLIVDEMHNDHPELLKDQFWNKIPEILPDLGKSLQKGNEKNTSEQDVIDFKVVQTLASSYVRPLSDDDNDAEYKNNDVETGNTTEKPVRPSMIIDRSLIPRSSVVSGKFKNDAAIMKEQGIIERHMEEVRKNEEPKATSNKENEENSSAEESEPET